MTTPALDPRIRISENMVFRDHDQASGDERFLRVLHLPHLTNEIALANISDPNCLPFWLDLDEFYRLVEGQELEPCDDHMQATLRPDSSLSDSEKRERDFRWSVIEPLVTPRSRPDLDNRIRQLHVRERVEELNSTLDMERPNKLRPDKVLSYLRLFWRHGQIQNALVPNYRNRGGPGQARPAAPSSPKRGRKRHDVDRHLIVGVNITDDLKQRLIAGAVFRKIKGLSQRDAYEKTLDAQFSTPTVINGLRVSVRWPVSQLPSFGQYIYHTNKILTIDQRLIATEGPYAYAQRRRPRLGSTQGMAFGPASVFQIDATIADIYLCWRHDRRRLLGRPVVYIVVDMYSRMIVGFFVALSGPSWETASWAIENAFSDKVDFCASLGIQIKPSDWPCHHTCRQLMGDRGWDHLCESAGAAGEGLGYKLTNLPPYRPDLKGMVEGRFEFLTGATKWAPGAWRVRDRSEPRNPLDGAYTLDEFKTFLALKILEHNRTRSVMEPPIDWNPAKGLVPTPVDLWNHGCGTQGAPIRADLARVRANLLHVGMARETDRGLRFRGLHFIPEKPDPAIERWFVRANKRKWRQREIRWRPGLRSRILVPINGGEGFITFVLHPSNARFDGWSFEEVDEWHALQRADSYVVTDERNQIKAEYNARIALLDQQAYEAGSGLTPRTRRPRTDPEARSAEANEMRTRAELPVGSTSSSHSASPLLPQPPEQTQSPPAAPQASLRPNRMGTLRARRAAHDES